MNNTLQKAITQASALPDDLQERVAQQILVFINEFREEDLAGFKDFSIKNLERAYSPEEPVYALDDI